MHSGQKITGLDTYYGIQIKKTIKWERNLKMNYDEKKIINLQGLEKPDSHIIREEQKGPCFQLLAMT